jgi:hypothetical protein
LSNDNITAILEARYLDIMTQAARGIKIKRLEFTFLGAALNAIGHAAQIFGQKLDFSEASLPTVDIIMDDLHHTVKNLDPSEKWIDSVTLMYTGYLGYVIISRWGGEWHDEIEYPIKDGPGLKIKNNDYFLLTRVRKRLENGRPESINAYYGEVKQSLIKDERRTLNDTVFPDNHKKHSKVAIHDFDDTFRIKPEYYPETISFPSNLIGKASDWVISIRPQQETDVFMAVEVYNLFSQAWREKSGFASELTDFYGLSPGDGGWQRLHCTRGIQYRQLEIHCNLMGIYNGKRYLDPRYLEIYLRTVLEKFDNFRFRVLVTSLVSCQAGVARAREIMRHQRQLKVQG